MDEQLYNEIKEMVEKGIKWRDIFKEYNLKFKSISQLKLKFGRELARRRTS